MDPDTPWLVAHLAIGPFIFVLARVFQTWPPKKINHFYGYRTPRSMRNQDTWDEAQRYSTCMLQYAALATTAFQVLAVRLWPDERSIMASVAFLVVALLATIVATERHLKSTFDDEGNRKFPG